MDTRVSIRGLSNDVSSGDEDSGDSGYTPVAILHQIQPDYPSVAQLLHQQDTVKFNVLIAADGTLKESMR